MGGWWWRWQLSREGSESTVSHSMGLDASQWAISRVVVAAGKFWGANHSVWQGTVELRLLRHAWLIGTACQGKQRGLRLWFDACSPAQLRF